MNNYISNFNSQGLLWLNLKDSESNTLVFQWEIKVTQYECDELIAPKLDCLQYHTAPSGDLDSEIKILYLERDLLKK